MFLLHVNENFFKQEEERRDSRRNIVVPEETNLYRISSLEKREQEMAEELEKLQVLHTIFFCCICV